MTDFDDELDDNKPLPGAIDEPAAQQAVTQLLKALGEDIQREGLQSTPRRVARMFGELLSGYQMDPQAIVNGALFEIRYDEMVIVRDIEFYSLCEQYRFA